MLFIANRFGSWVCVIVYDAGVLFLSSHNSGNKTCNPFGNDRNGLYFANDTPCYKKTYPKVFAFAGDRLIKILKF